MDDVRLREIIALSIDRKNDSGWFNELTEVIDELVGEVERLRTRLAVFENEHQPTPDALAKVAEFLTSHNIKVDVVWWDDVSRTTAAWLRRIAAMGRREG